MSNYVVRMNEVESKKLTGRTVRVLTDLMSVNNMTAGICEIPPHSTMDAHSHAQEELIYILQGHGFVSIAGIEEEIYPGTLVYFPSGSEHFTNNDSSQTMQFLFCFSPRVVVGSYEER